MRLRASLIVAKRHKTASLGPNEGNQFMDGCSASRTAQGIDGAQVNHDPGSLKPCADRNRRACPT